MLSSNVNFDACHSVPGRQKAESQNNSIELIDVTPPCYKYSGIKNIKDNELNPAFSEQNCYGQMSACRHICSSITEIGRYFLP